MTHFTLNGKRDLLSNVSGAHAMKAVTLVAILIAAGGGGGDFARSCDSVQMPGDPPCILSSQIIQPGRCRWIGSTMVCNNMQDQIEIRGERKRVQ